MTNSDEADRLAELRERIDSLDAEILKLLNERARCALEVADVKRAETGDTAPIYYRPEREAQVLRHIMELNEGPLTNEKVAQVYRQIMSACLALEQPLQIAYLGPEGTFTHLAALKQFGHAVIGLPMVTVDDVFREVATETCNYGVVPVENSTEGVISHTLDNFLDSTLRICGEVQLRVHHHLMVGEGTDEADIARIYSHQQTFAQCRRWLDGHFPRVPRIAVTSNAEAAKRATDEKGAAAIAGEIAAETYGLRILARKIEDESDNTTRFIVVGREDVGPSGNDKTSIMISTQNQPGALYRLLEPFHRHEISLTSIITRPSKTGTWSYVFFIDFEGHFEDEQVKRVMQEIDADALDVKWLGSYPRSLESDSN
ncbi:MAG: prephenate dehydratase [Pseudomonadales bacterium]|nr:prephenate dehydratase [Pseudomonadales bacterium]